MEKGEVTLFSNSKQKQRRIYAWLYKYSINFENYFLMIELNHQKFNNKTVYTLIVKYNMCKTVGRYIFWQYSMEINKGIGISFRLKKKLGKPNIASHFSITFSKAKALGTSPSTLLGRLCLIRACLYSLKSCNSLLFFSLI